MKTTHSQPCRVVANRRHLEAHLSPVVSPFYRRIASLALAARAGIVRVAVLCLTLMLGVSTASAANILWVSDAPPGSATGGVFSGPGTSFTDQGFVTLLQNAGHNVNRFNSADGQAVLLTPAELAAINTNDLVIIGRAAGSGAFQVGGGTGGGPGQGSNWNAQVTVPLICMSPYLVRTISANRMGWFLGDVGPDDSPCVLSAVNPGSAATDFLFGGVAMNETNTVQVYNEVMDRNTSHILGAPVAGGVILARATFAREDTAAIATGNAIVGFPAGTVVAGGSNVLAGYRMYFSGGSRESAIAPNGIPLYTGRENLTATGEDIFLRAVQLALNSGVPPATDPTAPVGFVSHPINTTVLQAGSVTFSVSVTGAAPRVLQWQRDQGDGVTFTNIPDATTTFSKSSITLTNLGTDANGARFRVVASNPNNTATSDVAVLTVTPDTEPPVVLSASSVDGTNVTIRFNELLEQFSAESTFGYAFVNGSSVIQATLLPDRRSVNLVIDESAGPPLPAQFTVVVSEVADLLNQMIPPPWANRRRA